MKLLLVGAFLCIGLASGAHIRRLTRETEAVIPSLVEEILKVELQSDLKQNKVDAVEAEQVIKKFVDEVVAGTKLEDAKPVIVEIIKEEPMLAVMKPELLASETPTPTIMEKVEIVATKDNLDTFRDEVVPKVEATVEPLKEAIITEVKVDGVKLEQPMLRNVIKEEIPQIEELRNIEPVEKEAVKESLPEPVVALSIAEPVLMVEEQVKTVAQKPVLKKLKEEAVAKIEKTEALPEKIVEIVEEKKEESFVNVVPETPIAPEMPIAAEIPVVAEIKEKKLIKDDAPLAAENVATKAEEPIAVIIKETIIEIKKLAPEETVKPVEEIADIVPVAAVIQESALPVVEVMDPEVRQNNPLQQAAQAVTQTLSTLVTNLVGNSANTAAADTPASDVVADAVGDESASTTTARPFSIIQSLGEGLQTQIQSFNAGVQTLGQNIVSSVNSVFSTNAISSSEGAQTGPLQSLINTLRPSTPAPTKNDDKPVEIPAKVEGEKAPEAEKIVEVFAPVKEEEKPAEVVVPTIAEEKDSVKIEN